MSLHNSNKRWTLEDEENLRYYRSIGMAWDAVAIMLGRTVLSCKSKYNEMRKKAVERAVEQVNRDFTPMDVDGLGEKCA
jgi:hypothetical protein